MVKDDIKNFIVFLKEHNLEHGLNDHDEIGTLWFGFEIKMFKFNIIVCSNKHYL